jgi:hypothetical protein
MRFPLLALTLLLAAPVAAQTDGAFTLRQSSRDGRVNLNFQYEDGHSNYGRTFERAAFSDVKQTGDRITFALRRAPGVFTFEGRGSMERASGFYDFAPNADFQREIERIGFRGADDKALFVFALEDLTVEKIKQLQGLLADQIDTDGLVRLINHGAGLSYVQSMTDAGFKKLPADDYRRARDHGVTAEYARQMAAIGGKLSLEDLVRTRDHGVTADYAKAMRDAGYEVGIEDLVRARDHGVTVDYVKAMRAAGHKVTLEDLVRARSWRERGLHSPHGRPRLRRPPARRLRPHAGSRRHAGLRRIDPRRRPHEGCPARPREAPRPRHLGELRPPREGDLQGNADGGSDHSVADARRMVNRVEAQRAQSAEGAEHLNRLRLP